MFLLIDSVCKFVCYINNRIYIKKVKGIENVISFNGLFERNQARIVIRGERRKQLPRLLVKAHPQTAGTISAFAVNSQQHKRFIRWLAWHMRSHTREENR